MRVELTRPLPLPPPQQGDLAGLSTLLDYVRRNSEHLLSQPWVICKQLVPPTNMEELCALLVNQHNDKGQVGYLRTRPPLYYHTSELQSRTRLLIKYNIMPRNQKFILAPQKVFLRFLLIYSLCRGLLFS